MVILTLHHSSTSCINNTNYVVGDGHIDFASFLDNTNYVVGDGHIDFASFLDIMHDHSTVENCTKELMAGFSAQDVHKRGYIPGSEMKHILMNLGEKLSRHEGKDTLLEGRESFI